MERGTAVNSGPTSQTQDRVQGPVLPGQVCEVPRTAGNSQAQSAGSIPVTRSDRKPRASGPGLLCCLNGAKRLAPDPNQKDGRETAPAAGPMTCQMAFSGPRRFRGTQTGLVVSAGCATPRAPSAPSVRQALHECRTRCAPDRAANRDQPWFTRPPCARPPGLLSAAGGSAGHSR
jgi:hypothetical protein